MRMSAAVSDPSSRCSTGPLSNGQFPPKSPGDPQAAKQAAAIRGLGALPPLALTACITPHHHHPSPPPPLTATRHRHP